MRDAVARRVDLELAGGDQAGERRAARLLELDDQVVAAVGARALGQHVEPVQAERRGALPAADRDVLDAHLPGAVGHLDAVRVDQAIDDLLELVPAARDGHELVVGAEPALVLVEVVVLEPLRAVLERVLDELADELRRVVHAQLAILLAAVLGPAPHALHVAGDEAARDRPSAFGSVPRLLPGGDHEARGAALEVPGERRVVGLVEVVDAEDRDVVGVRHHAEVLGVDVAEREDRGHPGVLSGHVAVEEQRGPAEEREARARELVELHLGVLALPGDPGLVVLAQGLPYVQAAIVAAQAPGQHHELAGGGGLGEATELVDSRGGPLRGVGCAGHGPGLPRRPRRMRLPRNP